MPCHDIYQSDRARRIAALEIESSAARHEALNRLDLCQMELMLLGEEVKENAELDGQRIVVISRELNAIAVALDRFKAIFAERDGPKVVSVSDVIGEAVAALGDKFEKLGVEIVIVGGDLTLEIDLEALRAVFIQLLVNSFDAFQRARRGEGREIRIDATMVTQSRCYVIYRDNGPGIDTDRLGIRRTTSHALVSDQIFSPGVSSSGAPGFGLTIAKRLLEGLGGSIGLVPSSAVGVQFKLDLPVTSMSR